MISNPVVVLMVVLKRYPSLCMNKVWHEYIAGCGCRICCVLVYTKILRQLISCMFVVRIARTCCEVSGYINQPFHQRRVYPLDLIILFVSYIYTYLIGEVLAARKYAYQLL